MSPPNTPGNQRRAARKRVPDNAIVTDVIRDEVIGHLGNLSSGGMLLITSQPPRSEALYQVSIALPATGRALVQSQPIEVGIQEQWHEHAASSGQIWAGFRIVAITDADAGRLESWLAQG
ncbi:MAG TPA: PilZ domain-containing protein [Rhodanobacter sp.]|nr:PilZ domain-containing protein [Rhodanobacter sp.]